MADRYDPLGLWSLQDIFPLCILYSDQVDGSYQADQVLGTRAVVRRPAGLGSQHYPNCNLTLNVSFDIIAPVITSRRLEVIVIS